MNNLHGHQVQLNLGYCVTSASLSLLSSTAEEQAPVRSTKGLQVTIIFNIDLPILFSINRLIKMIPHSFSEPKVASSDVSF